MFGWLKKLFSREQRGFFRYHDGARWRYGDPWAIHRAIFNDKYVDAVSGHLAAVNSDEPDTSQFLQLVARVFQLNRWNGSAGLTDSEVLAVFESFCDYVDAIKKNINVGPTSPRPMESNSPSDTDQAEPGNGFADLHGTENAQTHAAQST